MTRLTRKLAAKGREAARKAYQKVETRVLVAEGRKAVKAKVRATGKVGARAAKTGALVGALAAAAVVVREVRKRRALDA
ncbi:MAG: hypothetical protein IPI38_11070 [Gemmatimonadetes bacterium]|nr:hypothetical protein [Gemmatimonadota bacterium]MBK6778126.1 hypothetical protein [Gemmatimonadota bacterium]MBK7715951.1 hypothetical protein [Gemmatimonadota bacterium]MBK7925122.1 hypothetical protein [Gemmatimonadota bacterium]MBK9693340.1 hypothetical protein [Gemmatimonadota bacterium]